MAATALAKVRPINRAVGVVSCQGLAAGLLGIDGVSVGVTIVFWRAGLPSRGSNTRSMICSARNSQ